MNNNIEYYYRYGYDELIYKVNHKSKIVKLKRVKGLKSPFLQSDDFPYLEDFHKNQDKFKIILKSELVLLDIL